jgi:hypothetical protein
VNPTATNQDPRHRLRQVETGKSELKEQLREAKRQTAEAHDVLVRAADRAPGPISELPEYQAHRHAQGRQRLLEEQIDAASEEGLKLAKAGHDWRVRHAGRAPQDGPRNDDPAGDGWATAARTIDLASGVDRVETALTSLLGPTPLAAGGVSVTPSSELSAPLHEQPFIPMPLDTRGLFAYLPGEQLDGTTPSIADYKQVSREVEKEITRDPIATSAKAELKAGIELATDPLLQFALFLPGVQAKLFDYIEGFTQLLQAEMQGLLVKRLNLHIIEQIEAAAPPVGEKGESLLEKLRWGAMEVKDAGGEPSLAALAPEEAAELDLSTTGTDKALVFPARTTGTASPTWSLRIVEVPGLESGPILIDPVRLAKVFYGTGRLKVDEGTELDKNLVRLELSFEALCNIRQVVGGAYLIGKEEE